MSATHTTQFTAPPAPVLYVALELSWRPGSWPSRRLGAAAPNPFGSGSRHSRSHGRDQAGQEPIRPARRRHRDLLLRSRPRWLLDSSIPASKGVQNIVVDSASIEVNRRKRRAKSDRLDAIKLVSMLIRWHNGEKKVWAVVHVPTVDRRGSPAAPPRADRAEGRAHRASSTGSRACWPAGLEHRR